MATSYFSPAVERDPLDPFEGLGCSLCSNKLHEHVEYDDVNLRHIYQVYCACCAGSYFIDDNSGIFTNHRLGLDRAFEAWKAEVALKSAPPEKENPAARMSDDEVDRIWEFVVEELARAYMAGFDDGKVSSFPLGDAEGIRAHFRDRLEGRVRDLNSDDDPQRDTESIPTRPWAPPKSFAFAPDPEETYLDVTNGPR
jgi:hypothetical protein